MAQQPYAVVDQNGNVTNIVEWDGGADWQAPQNCVAVPCSGTTAYIGGTYLNGQFSSPPAPPPPTPAQQAAAALAAGVQITSTGTQSLNGLYGCDTQSQNKITSVVLYTVVNNGTFPGGQTTMPWHDLNNNAHVFPSVASFIAFASAIATYVAQVSLFGNSNGQMGSLPSNAITIP